MSNNEQNESSIITDINEAKKAKGENPEPEQEEQRSILDGMEESDFELSDDQSMEDQVSNIHGQLFMQVMKRIELSGQQVGYGDVQMIAKTINQVLEQKILYFILEELGVESIEEVVDEEDKQEIKDLFELKTDLSVSPEDLENLDLD